MPSASTQPALPPRESGLERGGASPARDRRRSLTRLVARDRVGIAVVLLVLVAFALRVAVYLEAPRPFEGAGLAAAQGEIARNIVDHGEWFVVNREATELVTRLQVERQALVDPEELDFSSVDRQFEAEPVIDQMPGVGLVLAGIWWVTGSKTYAPLQWLQIVLDSVMVLLVYWIGRRLTHRASVGLIAALLYAIWAGAIVIAKRPVPDTWASFFVITCVAAFLWARDNPASRRRLVVLGLVAGVGIFFRPLIVLLPAALAIVAAPARSWRQRLAWVAIPTAVTLLVLAPWTLRNYYEFDRFIPARTGLGQAVFEGIGGATSDEEAAGHVQGSRPDAEYGSPTYDGFLLAEAVRAIADDPGWYFELTRERARFLLPCLLVVFVWRRWRSAALVLIAAAVATIVPYIFIGSDTRFYLPAAFAYFLLIAMAMVVAAEATAQRITRTRRARGASSG